MKPKGKDSIQFTTHKGENGNWYFHMPFLLTFYETLCFPTVLNKLANGGTKLNVSVSTKPTPNSEVYTMLHHDEEEPGGSYWKTPDNELIWLCGWLEWYFNGIPNKLYVNVK